MLYTILSHYLVQVSISHKAGCQEIPIFCRFVASTLAAATSKKRCHRSSLAATASCNAPTATQPTIPDPLKSTTPQPPPKPPATIAPSSDYTHQWNACEERQRGGARMSYWGMVKRRQSPLLSPLFRTTSPSSSSPSSHQTKGGRDSEKKCRLKRYQYSLLGESIGKAIVSLQIPEVLSNVTIQVLLCKKFELAKRLYCFRPLNFQRWSDTSTFTPKNLNRQSNCIVSNPWIFKGEAIQVLLCQKIWIGKAIVSFQTPDL